MDCRTLIFFVLNLRVFSECDFLMFAIVAVFYKLGERRYSGRCLGYNW